MVTHQRAEDLINLGAYASGANPRLDVVIKLRPQLIDFLKGGLGRRTRRSATPWAAARLGELAG